MPTTFRQALLFSLRVWGWGLLLPMVVISLFFTIFSTINYTWWDHAHHFKGLMLFQVAFAVLTIASAIPGVLITAWSCWWVSKKSMQAWNKRILVFGIVTVGFFLPGVLVAAAGGWALPALGCWIPFGISLFVVQGQFN